MPANEEDGLIIQSPCVLLVEGGDDEAFFTALAAKLGLENRLQIIKYGGVANLRALLRAFMLAPRAENVSHILSLGIVRDADTSLVDTFSSITGALREANLPTPKTPIDVTPSSENNPRISTFIFPDNSSAGCLETLCLRALHQESAMPCVEQYFVCLTQQKVEPLVDTALEKAKIRVLLASKPDDLWLRLAFRRSFWPWDNPIFDQAKSFLRQLIP